MPNALADAGLARRGIALYIPDLWPGGAERVAVNLAGAFVSMGIPVTVFCHSYLPAGRLPLPAGVSVTNLGVDNMRAAVPRLVAELRARQPLVLISLLTSANTVAAIARMRARIPMYLIVTEHMHPSLSCRFRPDYMRRFMLFAANSLLYRTADAIVAVSSGVRDDMIRWLRLPPDLVRVVHNPIADVGPDDGAQKPFVHPWPDFRDEALIVGAGRLENEKNFPLLIRAFRKLRDRRAARLVILGDGSERGRLECLISELGLQDSVLLTGFVDEPFLYLRHASLFVLSSNHEGFGNVIVEALACGTPVVSTDCVSGPGEILQQGKFGVLTPVGDVDALARAMEEALDREWDREALRSRAGDFKLDTIARQYLDLLAAPPKGRTVLGCDPAGPQRRSGTESCS
jgi:glycosyltransferase involved in cell wall biosynthesis